MRRGGLWPLKTRMRSYFSFADLVTSSHPELLICRSFQVCPSNTTLVSIFIGLTCIDVMWVRRKIEDTFLVTQSEILQ